jgi:hypothetical protein
MHETKANEANRLQSTRLRNQDRQCNGIQLHELMYCIDITLYDLITNVTLSSSYQHQHWDLSPHGFIDWQTEFSKVYSPFNSIAIRLMQSVIGNV